MVHCTSVDIDSFVFCIDSSVVNKRRSNKSRSVRKYSKRTARTFEIVREVNEKGEMGKCGFFLHSERPAVIQQIVPGKY